MDLHKVLNLSKTVSSTVKWKWHLSKSAKYSQHLKIIDVKLLVVDVIIIIALIITSLDFLFRNFTLFPVRIPVLYSIKLIVWQFSLIFFLIPWLNLLSKSLYFFFLLVLISSNNTSLWGNTVQQPPPPQNGFQASIQRCPPSSTDWNTRRTESLRRANINPSLSCSHRANILHGHYLKTTQKWVLMWFFGFPT